MVEADAPQKEAEIKVLFLDVDGVLNRIGTKERNPSGTYGVEPEKAEMIRRIVKATGCFVVVSSTWRLFPDHMEYLWRCLGDDMKAKSLGHTPVFRKQRGDEISHWLKQHPGVSRFVVIDDDSDMNAIPASCFVRTHASAGLTDQLADWAIQILGPIDNPVN